MFFDTNDLINEEIKLILTKTTPEQKEKNWLPAYYFDICLLDGTLVGKCDLRIGHNEKTYIGGNVGYEVFEKFRGNKYATKACNLLFKQARKHKMNYLYITCEPNNLASANTCEYAGGSFIEVATIPADNEMYTEGKREVKIYYFKL